MAFQRGGNRVLEDNLAHVRESIGAIKERDEERLAAILAGYSEHQCQQVLDSIHSSSAPA